MLVWQAHQGKIESAAISADGKLLATATGGTRTVPLWEPTTGQLVRKLSAPGPYELGLRSIKSVAFAPDAPLFAAGSALGLTVWRTDTWEPRADLRLELSHELAFGPGARPMLAASSADQVGLWDEPTDSKGDSVPGANRYIHTRGGVGSLDFSPDGRLLATSTPYHADLWTAADAKHVRSLRQGNAGNRGAVRFSPDGGRVAMVYGKWLEVHPVAGKGGPLVRFAAGAGRSPIVWAVNWTADGRALLTAGNDGHVRLWDANTGAELRSFDWGIGKLYCAAFSPDGLTCAVCGSKGQVVVWDVDV